MLQDLQDRIQQVLKSADSKVNQDKKKINLNSNTNVQQEIKNFVNKLLNR